jgi:hypothetical protein
MERAIIIFVMAMIVTGLGYCNKSHAADNTILIDQIGNNNTTTIVQDGSGNSATVKTGTALGIDYNTFSITQQGNNKTASIELKSGISNTFNIQQDGNGNHSANIQNFIGSGNSVSVTQQGAGNHIFNATNASNNTNSGNTITSTQSGGVGADKQFDLMLSGATGATVIIQQTNPTTPNQGGMNIQCTSCGGTWSYIRQ